MLRSRKYYRIDRETETMENNSGQVEQVESRDRLEVDCAGSSGRGTSRDLGENNLENQSRRVENMMDNPVLTILLNEIRAQNTKFATLEQKLAEHLESIEQNLAGNMTENLSSLENRLKQNLAENASSLENMKQNLGENLSSLESRLKQDLAGNLESIKQNLAENVISLENRLKETVESKLKENNKEIESRLQEQTARIRVEMNEHLEGEIDRILNVELSEVHGKVGGLGEVVKAMDNKIEKIESSFIEALEKLELNPKDKTASINPTTNVNNNPSLDDKSVENNNHNVPIPEQNSFRNLNIGLTDVTLPKFGNSEGQNPLKF